MLHVKKIKEVGGQLSKVSVLSKTLFSSISNFRIFVHMSVLLPLNSAATVFSLNLTKGFHFYNITIYIYSLANGISQLGWIRETLTQNVVFVF